MLLLWLVSTVLFLTTAQYNFPSITCPNPCLVQQTLNIRFVYANVDDTQLATNLSQYITDLAGSNYLKVANQYLNGQPVVLTLGSSFNLSFPALQVPLDGVLLTIANLQPMASDVFVLILGPNLTGIYSALDAALGSPWLTCQAVTAGFVNSYHYSYANNYAITFIPLSTSQLCVQQSPGIPTCSII